MVRFQELDAMLAGNYADDYWADDVVLTARDLVAQFTPLDWTYLQNDWRQRSPQWQYRCAETLCRDTDAAAIAILTEMIETGDDELAISAADSLNQREVLAPDTLSEDAIARLRELSKNGPVSKLTVEQLIRKLNQQPSVSKAL